MSIVVVGGHTRNIGKTGVVAGIVQALPEMRWTAFKITQYGHGVCSANGEACDCEIADHSLAITEEHDRWSTTDSARYLAAGALRSFWVRTRQGDLAAAMPRVRREMQRAEGHVIVESNSVLRFLQPDVLVMVLDAQAADFKESARRYLDRVDAVVLTGGTLESAVWPKVSIRQVETLRRFDATPPDYCPTGLIAFLRARL